MARNSVNDDHQIYVGYDGQYEPIYLDLVSDSNGESCVIFPKNWEQFLKNTAVSFSDKWSTCDPLSAERFDTLATAAAEGTPIKLSELRWLQVTGLLLFSDEGTMYNLPLISEKIGDIQCPPTQWTQNCRSIDTVIKRNFKV